MQITHLRLLILLATLRSNIFRVLNNSDTIESTFQAYVLATPKLKLTIDIEMACFIKSGSFTCCIKQSWCYHNIATIGSSSIIKWEVITDTPGELWYVVHHI